ncbi:MAG TPA: HEAT repeat domain-containing protein, partial [Candidatus Nanopelagicales bacterium]|nr:HEAT repeat domain-containing protein [Candidatus Nanopelagicales bacterium]
ASARPGAPAPLKLALPATLTIPEISRHAAELGWIWSHAERDDAGSYASVTWTSSDGATIHLRVGIATALWFEGPAAEAIASQARPVLPLRDRRDLLTALSGDLDPETRKEALLALSAVAPERLDAEIERVILADTQHAEPAVRWEAVRAAGGTGWRELLPRLAAVSEEDPDPHVRKLAGTIVALMGG